jgi:hypothetical protein
MRAAPTPGGPPDDEEVTLVRRSHEKGGAMTVAPTPVHTGREVHRSRWVLATIIAFLLGGLTVATLYESHVFESSSTSGTQGSGVLATQTRHLPSFTSVELAGSNNVVVHVGEKQSVVVKADDNLIDRVTTKARSGTLIVGNTRSSFSTKSPMRVAITVPTLDALTLTGNGNIVVDGIEAESLKVDLPGNGTLTANGTATRLDVTVSGSGVARFTELVANDVQAAVSGSGSIFVTATKSLDASVSGSGAILYAGNPQDVTRSVTGSGVITGR